MVWKLLVMTGIAASAAGCTAVTSKIPFYYHEQPVGPETSQFERDPHRQYYDKLHRRYYYYDPVKKAYFWENGQPKG